MAKVSKAIVDKELRERVFASLFNNSAEGDPFYKINDRQYGILLTDTNGETRYIRIGAIVAEQREDMTAEELMQSEIDAYNQKQIKKAENAQKRVKKAEKDKARRAAKEQESTDL